ncbi:uncharacterized protein LOC142886359 [Nelusetta ayraudi]|uniref:uncharacterized protein LOC142886359 n=1 Tax=Nelusetta ayraudi TaxID=303726 RepID=UPI003F711024
MAPNTSSDSLSNALEALAEVTLANFTQAQVQDDTFVRKVFHVKIRPFLASSSSNFLFCLSTKNFSCQTYQTVVQALDSQMALMDRERQRAVFTHFMRAFLSRNDSSEPGCVSRNMSSTEWIQANLGSFSKFATLEDLLALNSNLNQNVSEFCTLIRFLNNTHDFFQNMVPDDLKIKILPCFWPLALSSTSRSEADLWFDHRLRTFLQFLNRNLISSNEVQNASCFAFQKLVFFMGNNFTFNTSEFGRSDFYSTIRAYLSAGPGARCYNASDPELNSTAWFANYISSFVTFMTLDDLASFVSISQIGEFLVNQDNLDLFNNTAISENVTNFYLTKLFEFSPTFSALRLPGFLLCSPEVPSSAYSSLSENDNILILHKLTKFCNGSSNTEVSAAVASNTQTITLQMLATLGSASTGLTIGQIKSVLVSSLSILSVVRNWNLQQSSTIIQTMGIQIRSSSSLLSLGTLVHGLPSQSLQNIPADELISIAQNNAFVSTIQAAPEALQQTFVRRIITVDSSPASLLANVPDIMTTKIPPSLLGFSDHGTVDLSKINQKRWTRVQAPMFFGLFGEGNIEPEQLSPSMMQGFTCSSVQRMSRRRIRQMVRACRPRRFRAKVELKESQLTCMYSLLSDNLSKNFTEYPAELLLYFNNQNVERVNCRSYFIALGKADFTVASSILNKNALLLNEAKDCLGISGVKLSRDDVEVLGNMACTLNAPYIQESDPSILEKLKACKDFSDGQVAAMETLLLSGTTQYGNVSTWNKQTLEDLGILPLYLTSKFWSLFSHKMRSGFLKNFMPQLRRNRTAKRKLKKLFRQLRPTRVNRGAGCTVGNITQVTINDGSFPFGYDRTQFDLCLDLNVLEQNLYSICEKVDDNDYQKIILQKLNQVFPAGVSDSNVRLLGSVSRTASLEDISKWNITTVDTLTALMDAINGPWEAENSKAIITKYLNTTGNSLGSTELNSIDSNICSLDTSTLRTITVDSIKNVKPLNLMACSYEQKQVLYEIANMSFSSQSANSFFNLIANYLGGAPLSDIVALSTQNISMDAGTLQTLNSSVINGLTVENMRQLMGRSLPDLNMFQNTSEIRNWINLQTQEDLNRLGLGLITTRMTSTQAPLSSSSSESTASASTQAPLSSSSSDGSVTGSGTQGTENTTTGRAELGKYSTSVFLVTLLTAVLQMFL